MFDHDDLPERDPTILFEDTAPLDESESEPPCPTCGDIGCCGLCNASCDYAPCTVCRRSWVDAAHGYDTCAGCLAAQ